MGIEFIKLYTLNLNLYLFILVKRSDENMRKNFCRSLEKGDLLPILLMTPAILIILGIMLVPLLFGIFMSFFDYNIGNFDFARDFVGLANYANFFTDPIALKSIVNTLEFSVLALGGDLFFGTLAAVLIFRLSLTASRILRPVITMPLLISPIIVSLIWRMIYDGSGLLYWFLGLFNIGIEQFAGIMGASTALFSTVIAHWWQTVPFVIIIISAGLVSIDQSYYEAAYVDGAGAFRSLIHITIPMLAKVYMTIIMVSGIDTIKVFDLIFGLTGGGPNNSTYSISLYAYKQGFEYVNMGYAMVLSIVAMLMALVCFGIPVTRQRNKLDK